MVNHSVHRLFPVNPFILLPHVIEFLHIAHRHVRHQVMGWRLVCDDVWRNISLYQFGMHYGGIAHQTYRQWYLFGFGVRNPSKSFIKIIRHLIAITFFNLFFYAFSSHLYAQDYTLVHGYSQWLCSAHTSHARSEHKFTLKSIGIKYLFGKRRKGLVRSLQDALSADINPAPRRHLTVHSKSHFIVSVKHLLFGPCRHQIRVGNDDARGPFMRSGNIHRLPGLNAQGFIVLECFEGINDSLIFLPVPGCTPGSAIHNEFFRLDGDIGIKIVH